MDNTQHTMERVEKARATRLAREQAERIRADEEARNAVPTQSQRAHDAFTQVEKNKALAVIAEQIAAFKLLTTEDEFPYDRLTVVEYRLSLFRHGREIVLDIGPAAIVVGAPHVYLRLDGTLRYATGPDITPEDLDEFQAKNLARALRREISRE